MTVLIHYTGSPNFPVLLTQIQPQLSEDDDIYVVDTTPNREGLRLAKLYGSTRCYIFVEVGKYSWAEAYMFAYRNMQENKQGGILSLHENLIISSTFISNIKKASGLGYDVVIPRILKTPYPQLPSSFTWYNPPVKKVVKSFIKSTDCFYARADKDNEEIGYFKEETVVLIS